MKFFICFLALLSSALAVDPPFGQLSVSGTKLKGSNGQDVQLRGMSLFWSQWGGHYYNAGTVQAIKCNWNGNLIRAAMAVDQGGYLQDPTGTTRLVNNVVQAAIDQGIYVIIDWHTHDNYQAQAVKFFSEMAQKYAGVPNVIYETFNEPLGVSWTGNLVPYHTAVVNAIRQFDTKNVIILGTPSWSQEVDTASRNPLPGQNLMYTLHYYAGTHFGDLRSKAQTALNNKLPIFVTEYGLVNADGNGGVNTGSSNEWYTFLDQNSISHANWALNDKPEGSSALRQGTPTTLAGVGADSSLTASGKAVKDKLKGYGASSGVSCNGVPPVVPPVVPTTVRPTNGPVVVTRGVVASTATPVAPPPPANNGNGKLTVAAVITASWDGGAQITLEFTNNDSRPVCSATFTSVLRSGQSVVTVWNMEAASSTTQFKLPSWVNIPVGGKFSQSGMSLNGSNTPPTVNVVSYGYC